MKLREKRKRRKENVEEENKIYQQHAVWGDPTSYVSACIVFLQVGIM